MPRITELPALATSDDDAIIPLTDVDTGITKKITVANFKADLRAGTTFTNGAIKAASVDLSVTNQAARDAIVSPWEGLLVYREDLDKQQIYDGAAWRTLAGWELLGSQTLSVAGDLLSLTSLAARKFLRIFLAIQSTGGNIASQLRFNNDSATNYAQMLSVNFGAMTQNTSQDRMYLNPANSASAVYSIADVVNISNRRKTIMSNAVDDNNASATTSSNNIQNFGKWDNVSAQITRVDFLNGGTGDFAIGSQLVVIGADF